MSEVCHLCVTVASVHNTRCKAAAAASAYVELVLLSATQTVLARAKAKVGAATRFGVKRKKQAAVSGVRVRLYERRGPFGLADRFCGETVLRVNLSKLRAPEAATAPLCKRFGHPKDVVSGSIDFVLAFETASLARGDGGDDNDDHLPDDGDDDAPAAVAPPASAQHNDGDDEFANLIFGARAPSVLAAVSSVAAAAPAPAPVAAAAAATAAVVVAEDVPRVSVQFNDAKIEEALCGASFVIMPKDDDCGSVRDGPAAVEMQTVSASGERRARPHLRSSAGGQRLLMSGDGAVCTNVRLLGMKWYCEATVKAVGAGAAAHCRVGVCVSSMSRAVFVDGAALAGDDAAALAAHEAPVQWGLGDVLSLLVDVDTSHVYCWRHTRAAAERLGASKLSTSEARLLHVERTDGGVRVYGAVGGGWSIEFNFGATPFVFRVPAGARTLHSRLADAQVGEAHALFDELAGSTADEALIADERIAALQSALTAQSPAAKSAEDALLLVLAWRCDASTLWTLTRDEFVLMCMRCGVCTLPALAELLAADVARLLPDLASDDAVELYNYAFDYLRDDAKVLPLDDAVVAWALLLAPKRWPLYDDWLRFVAQSPHKAIARDPWQQALPFAARFPTRATLAAYDADNSAFNVLFDEFAAFVNGV